MMMLTQLRWALLAAGSCWACQLAVQYATPFDRALPLLGIVATLLAAVSHGVIAIAVPMLIVVELAIPDESLRLLVFGAIMAGSFVTAVAAKPPGSRDRRPDRPGRDDTQWTVPVIAVAAIVLLRWIPLHEVYIGRELFLLAIAALTVVVLGRTPFAIAVGVVTALFTPAIPLRTLALPLIVLATASIARTFGMPAVRLTWPSSLILAFALLFVSWSGVVARGALWFFSPGSSPAATVPVARALSAGESAVLEVPAGASSLVVSGANASRLPRGALLGRIEPGGREIRIGDAADWGYMRREQFYAARNPLPRDAAGQLRGYGQTAWVDGAGRIALMQGLTSIRVTADPALEEASLQIERFELRLR